MGSMAFVLAPACGRCLSLGRIRGLQHGTAGLSSSCRWPCQNAGRTPARILANAGRARPPHPFCQKAANKMEIVSVARPSMAEMAHAGEDHRQAMLVAGRNGLLIAHRAARLHDGRHPRLRPPRPRCRGRERTHPTPAPNRGRASPALRPARCTESTRLIWPAPTPDTMPPFASTMALLLTCLAHQPGETQIGHFLLGRRPLRHHLELPRNRRCRGRAPAPAGRHRPGDNRARGPACRCPSGAGAQQTHVLLPTRPRRQHAARPPSL